MPRLPSMPHAVTAAWKNSALMPVPRVMSKAEYRNPKQSQSRKSQPARKGQVARSGCGLGISVAVVKLVDQNGPLRG
jgi:hypothetical protein